ncbi:hypothetical protein, partial [Pyramidobacter piscolens]|uniref:hypothetical protein n=1 Tax=Pyramidobacter piscolens TaxID=638849 RepID=UPI0026659798
EPTAFVYLLQSHFICNTTIFEIVKNFPLDSLKNEAIISPITEERYKGVEPDLLEERVAVPERKPRRLEGLSERFFQGARPGEPEWKGASRITFPN